MKYHSSRNAKHLVSLSTAIEQGLAPDGGLFVPESLPIINRNEFLEEQSYPLFAAKLLKIFFAGDKLEMALETICKRAFSFPLPLKQLEDNRFVLELFHGSTASFKDFGAQFLAQCLSALEGPPKIILAATSGDTGSAVAAAFYKKANSRAIILYPLNRVSLMQEKQMTCWGHNIIAIAVNGNFDDCQKLVKSAFFDPRWCSLGQLNSANSINVGRLLPQMTYYAYISLQFYKAHGIEPGFIIPSGNLGNASAAFWAKSLGFPIRKIVLATNANRVLSDYLQSGNYLPKPTIATLASAMDVGNPSNLERLTHLFGSFDAFKNNMEVYSVSDKAIQISIKKVAEAYDYIACPHTATAFHVAEKLGSEPWIMVSTADPAKFATVISPLIKKDIPVSPQLQALLKRNNTDFRVEANLDAIRECVENL